MQDEHEAAARDLDSGEMLRGLSVEGVSPPEYAEPFPLDAEAVHRAIKRVARRVRGATREKECAALSVVHSALLRSLMNMRTNQAKPSGLVDAQGNAIASEPELGDGDPAGLRNVLFATLRHYRAAVPKKTWEALVFAYNCTQYGRPDWRVGNDEDLRRITYDQSPDGARKKPSPSGGFNLPAAHIYRMMGYDDEQ